MPSNRDSWTNMAKVIAAILAASTLMWVLLEARVDSAARAITEHELEKEGSRIDQRLEYIERDVGHMREDLKYIREKLDDR